MTTPAELSEDLSARVADFPAGEWPIAEIAGLGTVVLPNLTPACIYYEKIPAGGTNSGVGLQPQIACHIFT